MSPGEIAGVIWAAGIVSAKVADEPDSSGEGFEDDSLSPAERIGDAVSDWLHGHPRIRKSRFEPVEIVLFAIVVGIAFIIVAAVSEAFALGASVGAWDLLQATTGWAQLPLVVPLLGAALLAWYANERRCDEFQMYMRQDEADQDADDDEDRAGDVEQAMTLLLRALNRSRLAVACIGFLALLTVAGAAGLLVGTLHSRGSFGGSLPWESYLTFVAQCIAAVIPALACIVIAGRAWARGSYLLRDDATDAPVEDDPLPPPRHDRRPIEGVVLSFDSHNGKADDMSNARHHHPRSLKGTWARATALVMAMLAASLLGTGVAQALVKALLPMGSQTVVLKVQLRSGGKSSFSGTFAGKPLQGKFEKTDPSIKEKLCQGTRAEDVGAGTTFTYGGKYDGSTYTFSGCLYVHGTGKTVQLSYRMSGKVGSTSISGSTFGPYSVNIKKLTVTYPFKGKVGSQVITGTATLKGTYSHVTVTSLVAHLKVSD